MLAYDGQSGDRQVRPDYINALFEFGGAVAVFLSVLRTLRERRMAGVSGAHVAFFLSWGLWNLFYYPNLEQMWSFAAGILLTLVNLAFALLWLKYGRIPK